MGDVPRMLSKIGGLYEAEMTITVLAHIYFALRGKRLWMTFHVSWPDADSESSIAWSRNRANCRLATEPVDGLSVTCRSRNALVQSLYWIGTSTQS